MCQCTLLSNIEGNCDPAAQIMNHPSLSSTEGEWTKNENSTHCFHHRNQSCFLTVRLWYPGLTCSEIAHICKESPISCTSIRPFRSGNMFLLPLSISMTANWIFKNFYTRVSHSHLLWRTPHKCCILRSVSVPSQNSNLNCSRITIHLHPTSF